MRLVLIFTFLFYQNCYSFVVPKLTNDTTATSLSQEVVETQTENQLTDNLKNITTKSNGNIEEKLDFKQLGFPKPTKKLSEKFLEKEHPSVTVSELIKNEDNDTNKKQKENLIEEKLIKIKESLTKRKERLEEKIKLIRDLNETKTSKFNTETIPVTQSPNIPNTENNQNIEEFRNVLNFFNKKFLKNQEPVNEDIAKYIYLILAQFSEQMQNIFNNKNLKDFLEFYISKNDTATPNLNVKFNFNFGVKIVPDIKEQQEYNDQQTKLYKTIIRNAAEEGRDEEDQKLFEKVFSSENNVQLKDAMKDNFINIKKDKSITIRNYFQFLKDTYEEFWKNSLKDVAGEFWKNSLAGKSIEDLEQGLTFKNPEISRDVSDFKNGGLNDFFNKMADFMSIMKNQFPVDSFNDRFNQTVNQFINNGQNFDDQIRDPQIILFDVISNPMKNQIEEKNIKTEQKDLEKFEPETLVVEMGPFLEVQKYEQLENIKSKMSEAEEKKLF